MKQDTIISANLSVILSVVVFLTFAKEEVGDFVQPWEKPWLLFSHYSVLLLFVLSAISLFSAAIAGLIPQKFRDVLLRCSTWALLGLFLMLFFILGRFVIAQIYGVG
ncbi:MAG: hypothetical protein QNJ58_14315 [Desulfobacterales bacterium]|nr:hypothetical protein [Desulfobacterales bacterium]